MDKKKEITHEEIFEIQRKQLLQWKSVLKPEIILDFCQKWIRLK